MKVISTNTVYENPLPQLRSRQAFFPWLCEKKDGEIVASFAIDGYLFFRTQFLECLVAIDYDNLFNLGMTKC